MRAIGRWRPSIRFPVVRRDAVRLPGVLVVDVDADDRPEQVADVLAGFPPVGDPAAVAGTPDEQQRAFDTVAAELAGRLRLWLSLPAVATRLRDGRADSH